jgi:signal transduction histidine kinase
MGYRLSAAARKVTIIRKDRLLLAVHPLRALAEAVLIAGVLTAGLLLLRNQSYVFQEAIRLSIGPFCMLWYVLRMRVPASFDWRRGCFDAAIAIVLTLALSAMVGALTPVVLPPTVPRSISGAMNRAGDVAAVMLVVDYVIFLVARLAVRVWVFWDRLRRRQLLWSLTHAHLIVIAVAAGLLIVFIDMLALGVMLSSSRPVVALIPLTVGLAALSVVALIIIVPPSALCSYLVVRGTVRRLQALMNATSALRSGDLAVRVPVVGEDEVAQLQSDFNAMAGDLERAVHELQGQRDTVARLLQQRRELIASASHELRTPVATLRGYLETTLIHWNGNLPPTLHHDLRVMEDEVIRLQRLVEDLFALARAEVGKLALQCKPTDAGEVVRHIVETNAPLVWQASKIAVVAEIPPALPLVLADPTRLEQALQNLLHNAVRHTSPGGIVALVITSEDSTIALHVKDTGEGIAPQDLPHIWERFYQTESARTRGGAGLGLALVKEWVEAMGGSVSVESMQGEGSCFGITLPQASAQNPPPAERACTVRASEVQQIQPH